MILKAYKMNNRILKQWGTKGGKSHQYILCQGQSVPKVGRRGVDMARSGLCRQPGYTPQPWRSRPLVSPPVPRNSRSHCWHCCQGLADPPLRPCGWTGQVRQQWEAALATALCYTENAWCSNRKLWTCATWKCKKYRWHASFLFHKLLVIGMFWCFQLLGLFQACVIPSDTVARYNQNMYTNILKSVPTKPNKIKRIMEFFCVLKTAYLQLFHAVLTLWILVLEG